MSSDSQPLLIHLHIPKNAGTTLGRSLRLGFTIWPPRRWLHYRSTLGYYTLRDYRLRLERIGSLTPKQQHRIRLFEAHAGYGLHESLPSPSTYITLFRDPIDRVLSIYFAHREAGRLTDDLSLADFVRTHSPGRIWWIDNAQVRYLAGEGGDILSCPPEEVTRSHLELAKQRLERDFLFFGLVEEFDQSINLLRRRLGWKRLYYHTSNVTRARQPKEQMPAGELDLVRQINELDIELYEYAAAKFQKAIAREGLNFQQEVEQFRATNATYQRTVGRLYWMFSIHRSYRRRQRLRQMKSARPPAGRHR